MSKIHSAGGERNEIFIFPIFSTTKPSLYQNKHEKSVKDKVHFQKTLFFQHKITNKKPLYPLHARSTKMPDTEIIKGLSNLVLVSKQSFRADIIKQLVFCRYKDDMQ